MKKEVEILVSVIDPKSVALKKLHGLKYVGKNRVLDVYFFDPKRKELQPDGAGQLTNCLRLRNKNGQASIAYKVDHFGRRRIWLYSDEYETEVDDLKNTIDILKKLGLRELVRINNVKSTFVNSKYEVVLEDVKDLGLFLEVERRRVGAAESVVEVKKEIWNWIKALGISAGLELTMGKPELMLRKKRRTCKRYNE